VKSDRLAFDHEAARAKIAFDNRCGRIASLPPYSERRRYAVAIVGRCGFRDGPLLASRFETGKTKDRPDMVAAVKRIVTRE
jgi:hypothetical protein